MGIFTFYLIKNCFLYNNCKTRYNKEILEETLAFTMFLYYCCLYNLKLLSFIIKIKFQPLISSLLLKRKHGKNLLVFCSKTRKKIKHLINFMYNMV